MELHSAEVNAIKNQIKEWLQHSDYELECTFGNGSVDATTFFQVAQRLRSKGLKEVSQEDRLTIMTPEHVRFTINTIGVIQQYCRDNILNGKAFIAMIKDRNSQDSQVDLDDYSVRVKTRREMGVKNDDPAIKELFGKWGQVNKAFRLIRRWSFDDNGIRYDLSIVRSTKQSLQKQYIWQKKFSDQDLAVAPYSYEIEVELSHIEGDTEESAFKRLIKGIGEVLRGIQKSSILISNTVKKNVINSYKSMIKTDENRFLGCSPVTLEQRNFVKEVSVGVPNIRTGYNVTDKADGLRCLAFVNKDGELFLIDMTFNVYRTGLKQLTCRESIIDGEFVTKNKKEKSIHLFLAFDIYYTTDKKIVSNLPFYSADPTINSRHKELKSWTETFNKEPTKLLPYLTPNIQLQVSMKEYLFANPNDLEIFNYSSKVLKKNRDYKNDGLILTPNDLPLPGYNEEKNSIRPSETFYEQFKWKPSIDNTIDFLVRFEKELNNPKLDRITIGIAPSGESIRYKSLRLYVGSSESKSYNPRDIILNQTKQESAKGGYRAVPFYPMDFNDTMASISYGIIQTDLGTGEEYIQTEINNEPIQDKSIIEMRYDLSKPHGWRWIPIRIRHDKTERLQKGQLGRTLNSEKVANSVWNSIHDPITQHMITTGSPEPSKKETTENMKETQDSEVYFKRKAPKEDLGIVKGMRGFHNGYIKEVVLYGNILSTGYKLIDLACGQGSDIRRWNDQKVSFVLGIDSANDNITNVKDGTYARYINIERENRIKLPTMIFVIGDTSKRIIDGKAGITSEESNILLSVFGNKPLGPVPAIVERLALGELKEGADAVSCMFALHYFFENKEKLEGLLQNIRETTKLGGYFFGCCFDGKSVFDLLQNINLGETKTGIEKETLLWTIRKEYDMDILSDDDNSLGKQINVDFISIGSAHAEYLVNFSYFTKKMKENGFGLLNDEELKEIGLNNSTNLFSKAYEMAEKAGRRFPMSDTVKEFSFLNRWFIFKKRDDFLVKERVEEVNEVKEPDVKVKIKKTLKMLEEEKKEKINNAEASIFDKTTDITQASDIAAKEEEQLQATLKRTVPVELGEGAPQKKAYSENEVFLFHSAAEVKDKLKIKDKGAARWLTPSAPFPIEDLDDPSIIYPSIEHFMASMLFKYGTDRPELGPSIFGRQGIIHQDFVNIRTRETLGGTKALSEDRDYELINEESTSVKNEITPAKFKKHKAVFNDSKYALKKDELLRKAVEQRYKKDARLQKIIEEARIQNKYLLFYTPGKTTNELGGKRRTTDGIIEGANKLGKLYMEFGGYKY